MPMRMRAEKKMRKHLLEQLKTRKILGARIAKGEKTEADLKELNLAPQVFLFKNLFSGQVLYSQVPAYHQLQIDLQFQKPNWQNRKPARRNDLWQIMCVANFSSYEFAVAAYKGLLKLRELRDTSLKKEANEMRVKNDEGNIWYAGQYRPTYSQEAVADLSHVIDEFDLENTRLFWENIWRKGEDERWRMDLVEHDSLPLFNPRDQTVLLDAMREEAIENLSQQENEDVSLEIEEGQQASQQQLV